jgi:hypothetical protein
MLFMVAALGLAGTMGDFRSPELRRYDNRLAPLHAPKPLLADHPELVEPVQEATRFEAPLLVDDQDADLHGPPRQVSQALGGVPVPVSRLIRETSCGCTVSDQAHQPCRVELHG